MKSERQIKELRTDLRSIHADNTVSELREVLKFYREQKDNYRGSIIAELLAEARKAERNMQALQQHLGRD